MSTVKQGKTLKDILRILFKRMYMFAIPTVAIFVAGMLIAFRLPKNFSAYATVKREAFTLMQQAAGPSRPRKASRGSSFSAAAWGC